MIKSNLGEFVELILEIKRDTWHAQVAKCRQKSAEREEKELKEEDFELEVNHEREPTMANEDRLMRPFLERLVKEAGMSVRVSNVKANTF